MKKRIISIILSVTLIMSTFACLSAVTASAASDATTTAVASGATANQQNIVDRANYMYNSTWVCQKTVNGWNNKYTFYAGNTYHLPYAWPVSAGAYIGFGISVPDFLAAAADANSAFYNKRSYLSGASYSYSTYYGTDCSGYVSWCWGASRNTTATIPNIATYKGMANTSNNTWTLQLGDALNSNSVGHVVLVTGLSYDSSGAITQIEITEQTPPQIKRSYYTPSSLASKYGSAYGIYRYNGTVPAAPNSGPKLDTSNPVNLGTDFYAQIVNVGSGKNLAVDLSNNNVIIYDRLSADDHIWKFERNSNGSYKIINRNNGMCLDVSGGGTANGTNVQLWTDNGLTPQEWFIYSYDGKYVLKSACTDCVLDISEGSTANGANAQTWSFNASNAQLYNFDILGYDKGAEFEAYIYAETSNKPVVGDDTGNAVISTEKGDGSEIWTFTRHHNGTYSIKDKNGRCLDVESGQDANELSVLAYPENGTNAQRWFIYESDGKYKLKPLCALGRAMDIFCDYTDDGTNVQIYDSVAGNQAAQSFRIIKIGENIGTDFYANIEGVNSGKLLTSQDNNAAIYSSSKSDNQLWKFERQVDNSYKIINMSNGYVLDIYGGLSDKDTNVQLYESNDSQAQRWFVYNNGDNYFLGSKATNCFLDVYCNYTDDGTNIQMYTAHGGTSQQFRINILGHDVGESFDAYICGATSNKPIAADETGNVVLTTKKGDGSEVWSFVQNANGSYTIKNKDGKCLDVTSAEDADETNVQVWDGNGSIAQNWFVMENNGTYKLKSQCAPGRSLDIVCDYTDDGTNVQIYDSVTGMQAAQSFLIEKPALEVLMGDVNGDGTVTLIDALYAQKAALQMIELDEAAQKAADINGDGTINIMDAITIHKMSLSL